MLKHRDKLDWYSVCANRNLTWDIFKSHPDIEWDERGLTRNTGLDLEVLNYIQNKDHIDWYFGISFNDHLNIDFINANINEGWCWYGPCIHSNITVDDIVNSMHSDTYKNAYMYGNREWGWDGNSGYIACNPNFKLSDVDTYPDIYWYWGHISDSRNVTMDDIRNNPDKPWDWQWIANNPNITIEFIKEYIDKPWGWKELSSCKCITMEFVNENIDKPWDFTRISENPNLTPEFVAQHPTAPWRWFYILRNPNFTVKDIEANIDKILDWNDVSSSPLITLDFITEYTDKPWDWSKISSNVAISLSDIESNPDKPWNWTGVSHNPNLTMDFIESHLNESWDWKSISQHRFMHDRLKFTEKEYRRYLAAYRIQQWWLRLRLDPRHPVCKKRLEREYAELFTPEAL
jgi:hypothetical protein